MKKGMLELVALLFLASLAMPVTAWTCSDQIAYLPSTCGPMESCFMGSWNPVQFPDFTFTPIQTTDLTPSGLAGFDTVFMYAYDPNQMSSQQISDLLAWVDSGGKLIICPGEDPFYYGPWDYSWLPEPIALSIPGAMGAQGVLTICEDSVLTRKYDQVTPIDVDYLGSETDAVGDADVLTITTPGWCCALSATNNNGVTGPVEMYDQYGDGVIIFNGLDWDYIDYNYYPDDELIQVMNAMFAVCELECGVPWTGNLDMTKEADETVYCLGDTIVFKVVVNNPNEVTATNVHFTDTPPAGVTIIGGNTGSLPDIPAGGGYNMYLSATADAVGTGLVNEILIEGESAAGDPFSGTATTTVPFDIKECVIPVNVDFKPGSCPNGYGRNDNGVLPVAILGSATLDVITIDPATVKLEGIPPLRWSIEDVGSPVVCSGTCPLCACWQGSPDGFADLNLKFDSKLVAALSPISGAKKKDNVPLTITGELFDGKEITGGDCLFIAK